MYLRIALALLLIVVSGHTLGRDTDQPMALYVSWKSDPLFDRYVSIMAREQNLFRTDPETYAARHLTLNEFRYPQTKRTPENIFHDRTLQIERRIILDTPSLTDLLAEVPLMGFAAELIDYERKWTDHLIIDVEKSTNSRRVTQESFLALLSSELPVVRESLDRVMNHLFHLTSSDNPLEKDSAFADSQTVKDVIRLIEEMKADRSDSSEITQRVQIIIHESIKREMGNIQRRNDEKEAEAVEVDRTRRLNAIEQDVASSRQLMVGLNAVNALFGSNPSAAGAIAIGSAAVEFDGVARAYAEGLVSGVAFASSGAVLVSTFASVLRSTSEDGNDVLLEQLLIIRAMLKEILLDLHYRFDLLDSRLESYFSKAFYLLELTLNQGKKGLEQQHVLAAMLSQIISENNMIRRDSWDSMRRLSLSRYNSEINGCNLYTEVGDRSSCQKGLRNNIALNSRDRSIANTQSPTAFDHGSVSLTNVAESLHRDLGVEFEIPTLTTVKGFPDLPFVVFNSGILVEKVAGDPNAFRQEVSKDYFVPIVAAYRDISAFFAVLNSNILSKLYQAYLVKVAAVDSAIAELYQGVAAARKINLVNRDDLAQSIAEVPLPRTVEPCESQSGTRPPALSLDGIQLRHLLPAEVLELARGGRDEYPADVLTICYTASYNEAQLPVSANRQLRDYRYVFDLDGTLANGSREGSYQYYNIVSSILLVVHVRYAGADVTRAALSSEVRHRVARVATYWHPDESARVIKGVDKRVEAPSIDSVLPKLWEAEFLPKLQRVRVEKVDSEALFEAYVNRVPTGALLRWVTSTAVNGFEFRSNYVENLVGASLAIEEDYLSGLIAETALRRRKGAANIGAYVQVALSGAPDGQISGDTSLVYDQLGRVKALGEKIDELRTGYRELSGVFWLAYNDSLDGCPSVSSFVQSLSPGFMAYWLDWDEGQSYETNYDRLKLNFTPSMVGTLGDGWSEVSADLFSPSNTCFLDVGNIPDVVRQYRQLFSQLDSEYRVAH